MVNPIKAKEQNIIMPVINFQSYHVVFAFAQFSALPFSSYVIFGKSWKLTYYLDYFL